MKDKAKFVITLFTRAARLGQVKKRLAVDTGKQVALLTHRFLVDKTLRALEGYAGAELQVWVDDLCNLHSEDPLCSRQLRLIAQKGESLGERMENAIRRNLKNGKIPIVIGSDCPSMNAVYIQAAKAALQSDFDVVIGPAEDGGYVLIGMKQIHTSLFEEIDWGTENVLVQTLAAAKKLDLRVHVLEVLWDVDRVEDLHKLSALNLPHYPGALREFGRADTESRAIYASTIS